MLQVDFNELNIHKIGSCRLWLKALIIIVACMILVALGYRIDIRKQQTLFRETQKKEYELRHTIENKQKYANVIKHQKEISSIAALFNKLLQSISEKTKIPALVEDISRDGLALGLEFNAIRLLPEKTVTFYQELPLEISVIGNYHQFATWLNQMTQLPDMLTLHDFVMHPITSSPLEKKLVMNITAKIYRNSANERVESTSFVEQEKGYAVKERFSYTASNLRSPFTPSEVLQTMIKEKHFSLERHRSKEDLEAYPLDALSMVGTVSEGLKQWVLIKSPKGKVYRLSVGNHLGQNNGKILSIMKEKILIQEMIGDAVAGWQEKETFIEIKRNK